ncbi:hypothetical protein B0H34DRAFT_687020 [Crassisporium funariophilum]|nr:hypothetical protein B0H34DRAFT_687020 [Crassisporium funariophilum]
MRVCGLYFILEIECKYETSELSCVCFSYVDCMGVLTCISDEDGSGIACACPMLKEMVFF